MMFEVDHAVPPGVRGVWRSVPGFVLLAVLAAGDLAAQTAPSRLSEAEPRAVGMLSDRLDRIDRVIAEGIRRGEMPGAVVVISRRGRTVFQRAYGNRQTEPDTVPMTLDTVFDMASITKPVATATSVMKLVEQGRVELEAPAARYLPEFGANGKQSVTILQLLTHQAGLIPDNALRDYDDGPEKAMERICALNLKAEPGTRFMYTDVGFLVLAEIVKRVSGQSVHEFSQEHVFGPLGMSETGYVPGPALRARAAPTEKRDGEWMRGEVHDPRAYRMNGVAGHAGLFSTAGDLAVYAQMMLGEGRWRDVQVLRPETVRLMTTSVDAAGAERGLGWDKQSPYSSNKGDLLTSQAFGHGGFTGTVLWIDPGLQLSVVFLSNRLHPDGKGSVNRLAGRVVTLAAAAIDDRGPQDVPNEVPVEQEDPGVLTGIDVLSESGFAPLQGRRIGLITNHTGRSRNGASTVRLLHEADGVTLAALFSPEHGFDGQQDVREIADSADSETGLRVFSLYGETRTPTPEMLKGLDVLVFDIQDIGARFYTYVATMRNCMQAAAKEGIGFVVLDRPNPINGVDVAGPVLDPGTESFVGPHTTPVRHGMTAGELAGMLNEELSLKLDLSVVRLRNWDRRRMFDATGLVWINPSPNMRSLTQAVLYPGIGLLETTNLSVGRGTDTPFEVIGAPWIQPRRLAESLNRRKLPGVRFVPIRFTPDASRHSGKDCGGVNIIVTDRRSFRPIQTGLTIALQLRAMYPDDWDVAGFNRLLSNQAVYDGVRRGAALAELTTGWTPALDRFRQRRARCLLYP